jgi:hypothetical protein
LGVAKTKRTIPVVVDQIGRSILILRGQRVILDRELAAIYGSTTKRLNEQIKRNRDIPEDFMFQLTAEEAQRSRSQIATLKSGRWILSNRASSSTSIKWEKFESIRHLQSKAHRKPKKNRTRHLSAL